MVDHPDDDPDVWVCPYGCGLLNLPTEAVQMDHCLDFHLEALIARRDRWRNAQPQL